jgi:hypothetical protein
MAWPDYHPKPRAKFLPVSTVLCPVSNVRSLYIKIDTNPCAQQAFRYEQINSDRKKIPISRPHIELITEANL